MHHYTEKNLTPLIPPCDEHAPFCDEFPLPHPHNDLPPIPLSYEFLQYVPYSYIGKYTSNTSKLSRRASHSQSTTLFTESPTIVIELTAYDPTKP